ncbi:MAG TPA: pseudouridine synthase [Candidatus Saccharimonadales bacterium]|nr:pseudouridine synthase [Candidatus Saccharimonadales bacterium]
MAVRINKFVAQTTGISRRQADQLIIEGKVLLNNRKALLGDQVSESDQVSYQGKKLIKTNHQTIVLNKPVGYVCSRNGQGSPTVYELLPPSLSSLKPIGRLDKDSSGLLLLTNDGNLALTLSHPRYAKLKVYLVSLDKPLMPGDAKQISGRGVVLSDGVSRLALEHIEDNSWKVIMHEGRNRQIRRTFEALGYRVIRLHRNQIGDYILGTLPSGKYKEV